MVRSKMKLLIIYFKKMKFRFNESKSKKVNQNNLL